MSYLTDLREVVKRGEGSSLRREVILRKVRRFELECKRAGVDVDAMPQAEFVKNLVGDPKEWMFRLCAARLLRGEYGDWTGWEYRNQWAIDSYRPDIPNRRWRLEKIKSLAILGEQGVGDEILFSSCIPDVQRLGIEVVVECDPRLEGIFRRSFGCETKPRDDIVNRGSSNYLSMKRDQEAFLPIGDLPRLFRKSKSDFPRAPFLESASTGRWAHLKGKTGLAWRGRRGQFEPQALMKAAGISEVVCLQYDAWPYETEGMIVPDCDLKDDLESLLGVCANLERVVTVPQTIVHMAGPQGVPVDVVVPPVKTGRVADQLNFRYGLGPKMDWYGSVNVFQSLHDYARQR